MMVDVHHTDGRTVFRVLNRGTVMQLLKRDPDSLDEGNALTVWVKYHPQQPEWERSRVLFVKKHSIAWIRMVESEERDEFLAQPEVAAFLQERQEARDRRLREEAESTEQADPAPA